MKDLKFRLFDKIYKTMIYPSEKIYINMFGKVVFERTDNSEVDEADEKTYALMQYTGLKDSTKWDQLLVSEKRIFYNSVCSEDGKSIKYLNIEDVNHIWKGKEIYEGDIVKHSSGKIYEIIYLDTYMRFVPTSKTGWIAGFNSESLEVIGNKYENPELSVI